jgi:hypothetical protein
MRFCELTHPRYRADQEQDAANPVRMLQTIVLPGMVCPSCGPVTGSRHLYLPIPNAALCQRLRPGTLPQAEWMELAHEVRMAAGLPDDYVLKPGDVLGTPVAELLDFKVPDFLHIFPGKMIVRTAVLDALRRAGCGGFRPVRAEARWSPRLKPPLPELPELYALVVTGTAWRAGIDREDILADRCCGRTKFPHPEWLVVDESRWDRSDFFNVDENPNIVLVTERVCETLQLHRFTNYTCIPVAEQQEARGY